MTARVNTFTKILTLIVLLLIPIIILYGISNRISVNTVKEEVAILQNKDLVFFASKITENASQIDLKALQILEDINVRSIEFAETLNLYELTDEKRRINEKLRLIVASSPWDCQISVYAPKTQIFLSSDAFTSYDPERMNRNFSKEWKLTTNQSSYYLSQHRFVRYATKPYEASLDRADLVVEMSFSVEDLKKSLDTFKSGGEGDPFFYAPGRQAITSNSANSQLIAQLLPKLRLSPNEKHELLHVTLAEREYLVDYAWLPELHWYLVDYFPIQEVIRPITMSSYMFYTAIIFLLLFSIPAAYYLYHNVQMPISELVRGVQKLKKGDYSVRIKTKGNNEFTFLIERFNDMAMQIEQLIQKVYIENLRSRDANLKQLQSQINPHFLYNCFALIRSLTRLGQKESVMSLALNLSRYYRYSTRVENPTALLREEIDLIKNYLEIQQLHIQGLQYSIDVPEAMMNLEIPRLLLQPLIENAVLHGIEPIGEGWIKIVGKENSGRYVICIIDNGKGMSSQELSKLLKQLSMPMTEDTGCALWNIRQRMALQFGEDAGLNISLPENGGFAVELYWPIA